MTASLRPTSARLRDAGAQRPAARGVRGGRAAARCGRAHSRRIRGWASTERTPAGLAARTFDRIADQRMAGGAPPALAG